MGARCVHLFLFGLSDADSIRKWDLVPAHVNTAQASVPPHDSANKEQYQNVVIGSLLRDSTPSTLPSNGAVDVAVFTFKIHGMECAAYLPRPRACREQALSGFEPSLAAARYLFKRHTSSSSLCHCLSPSDHFLRFMHLLARTLAGNDRRHLGDAMRGAPARYTGFVSIINKVNTS